MPDNKKRLFLLSLILFTTLVIYSTSFKNPFIWDDFHLILNDEQILSFKNLPLVFKTHLFKDIGGSNFYRPLQTASFMLDYSIWKLNPFGYHLTNIIFHLANVVLVYFFVTRIFAQAFCARAGYIGFLTSVIFAVHPVNTEAVTYISGRADPIGAFFFLSSFLSYARFRDNQKKYLLLFSALFFICSLLTKEAMLIFPLILILYDSVILRQKEVRRDLLASYAPYIFIVLFYIVFRLFILGLPLGFLRHAPFKLWILNMPRFILMYVGLLFFPINLHMERIEPIIRTVFGPQAIISLGAIAGIVWLLQLLYRRSRQLFFCFVFFILTLLPMLNILTINAMMAEHWLYLPSIGIFSIIAFGLTKAIDFERPILKQGAAAKICASVFIIFLSFFLMRTVLRNVEWGRPFEFYTNLIKQSPYSSRAHFNLGSIYFSNGQHRLAREEFNKAAEFNPASPFSYYSLGCVDYAEGNKKEAVKNWKIALDIAPFYEPGREVMIKYLYFEDKRFKRLHKAVSLNPEHIMANYRLSKLYLSYGLYFEAIDRLERILEVDPDYTNAIFNRAWAYSKLGLYTKAIMEYEKVLTLTPDDPDIYNNLGFCCAALNRPQKAAEMWRKAKELKN